MKQYMRFIFAGGRVITGDGRNGIGRIKESTTATPACLEVAYDYEPGVTHRHSITAIYEYGSWRIVFTN